MDTVLKKRTKEVEDTLEPDFEEVFTFTLSEAMTHVRVELRDGDTTSSSSLGCVQLPLGKWEKREPGWFALQPRPDKKEVHVEGEVRLTFEYFKPGSVVPYKADGRAKLAELYITIHAVRDLPPKTDAVVRFEALNEQGKVVRKKDTPQAKRVSV